MERRGSYSSAAPPPLSVANHWVPDDLRSHCVECRKGFGVFRRKHHCRLCGDVFCADCAMFERNGRRCCEACYKATRPNATSNRRGSFSFRNNFDDDSNSGSQVGDGLRRGGPSSPNADWSDSNSLSSFSSEGHFQENPATAAEYESNEDEESSKHILRNGVLQTTRTQLLEPSSSLSSSSSMTKSRLKNKPIPSISLPEEPSPLRTASGNSTNKNISTKDRSSSSSADATNEKKNRTAPSPSTSILFQKILNNPSVKNSGIPLADLVKSKGFSSKGEEMLQPGRKRGLGLLFEKFEIQIEKLNFKIEALARTTQRLWAALAVTLVLALLFGSVEQASPLLLVMNFLGFVLELGLWWNLASLLLVAFVLIFSKRSLFIRTLRVFYCAGIVIGNYEILKFRLRRWPAPNEEEETRLWNEMHARQAARVLALIMDLKGFWVKVGQSMSTRGDILPEIWVNVLSTLQDQLPSRPLDEVRRTVEEDLKGSIEEMFSRFDDSPLGSASIAQVHRAKLVDGTDVVVKVQHQNIKEKILNDIDSLRRIVYFVVRFEPDFDFRQVVDELSKAVVSELDFMNEANNMTAIRRNLMTAKIDAIIPQAIPSMVTSRVLVMTYVRGIKITDIERLKAKKVDFVDVLRKIFHAYAHQIYVDGFFNCDPHPGNILVQVDQDGVAHPVLLDFGLVKELNPKVRVAFARMVHCASILDLGGLLESFDEMGLFMKRFDPIEDMESIRFILRDSAPAAEAREESMSFHNEQWEKRMKLPRGQRHPVDAWPSDLVFYLRVTMMLRGLCSILGVRLNYFQLLVPYSMLTMVSSFPWRVHSLSLIRNPPLNSLEGRLHDLLSKMYAQDRFIGIQVAAYQGESLILNTCAGTMGATDPRSVESDSLFACFSISNAILALCLHLLVDRNLLRLDDEISHHIPRFTSQGQRDKGTIRHLLMHTLGVPKAGMEADFSTLSSFDAMLELICGSSSSSLPGERAQYHALAFGYLASELIRKVTRGSVRSFLCSALTQPLGVQNDFFSEFSAKEISDEALMSRVANLYDGLLEEMAAFVEEANDEKNESDRLSESYEAVAKRTLADFMSLIRERDSSSWMSLTTKDGVSISIRTGDDMRRYTRGQGVLNASPDEVLAFLIAPNKRATWDPLFKRERIIETVDENTDIVYSETKSLFMFDPRDVCGLRHVARLADGCISLVGTSVTHAACPPVAGYVRATLHIGGFYLEPCAVHGRQRSTRVTYISSSDAKHKKVPDGLLNKFSVEQALSVARIRKQILKSDDIKKEKELNLPQPKLGSLKTNTLPSKIVEDEFKDALSDDDDDEVSGEGGPELLEDNVADAMEEGLKPSLLTNPTLLNSKKARSLLVPSVCGFYSARCLAKVFSILSNDGSIGNIAYLSKNCARSIMKDLVVEKLDDGRTMEWGLGFQRFPFAPGPSSSTGNSPSVGIPAVFGHMGTGGSIVLCDPLTKLTLAITVNKLHQSNPCTREIVNLVATQFGRGKAGDLMEPSSGSL